MCLHEECAKTETVLPLGEKGGIWSTVQGGCYRNSTALGCGLNVCNNGRVCSIHQVTIILHVHCSSFSFHGNLMYGIMYLRRKMFSVYSELISEVAAFEGV